VYTIKLLLIRLFFTLISSNSLPYATFYNKPFPSEQGRASTTPSFKLMDCYLARFEVLMTLTVNIATMLVVESYSLLKMFR